MTERRPKRLLEQVRENCGRCITAIAPEQAYLDWIKRYIRFHGKRHPHNSGSREIEAFV